MHISAAHWLRATTIAIALHVPVANAAAQTVGSVEGTVVDTLGAAVTNARVVATAETRPGLTTATTGADGRFTMTLTPGSYVVRVSSEGFGDIERAVTVTADRMATIDVVLDVAALTESAVVVGRDYGLTETTAATRTPTPLLQVPQSVQVVTAQVIADQRPLILSDALRNVSGISSLRNSAEVFRSFNIRGFQTLDLSVDGLRNTYGLNDQPDAVAHLERVEVLKGPSASLYGRGGLGGTVNLVTKRPLATRRAELSMSTGSWGLVQPTVDLAGPLNGSATVRGRAVLDYENRDTPIDFVSVDRFQVAPSVDIDIRPGTTLQLKTDYRRREGIRFLALPTYGTVIGRDDLQLPYSRFIGEPGAGASVNTGLQSTGRVDSRIGEWTVTGAVRVTANALDMPSVGPRTLEPDNRTLLRRYTRFDESEDEVSVDAWASRAVRIGGLVHTVVIGADWARFHYDSQFFAAGVGALNIAQPVYGQPIGNPFLLDHTIDRIGSAGIYAQDQIAVTDRLGLLLGVRLDSIEKRREFLVDDRTAARTDTAVSPRAGASFLVRSGVALFGSYSEALEGVADGTANQTGTPFRPQQGRQLEGCVKLDFARRGGLTAALFTLTRTGGLVVDPNNVNFRIQTGEQRSRGLEVDTTWQISDAVSVLGTYTFTDGSITRDTTLPIGNALMNVPRHAGRLWTKVALPPTAHGIFAVAGGVTSQGEQQANLANTLTVPGSWVTDAAAFWERGRLGVQLNVINLFNREYPMRGAFGNAGIIPGDTRRIVLTIKTVL